MNTRGMPDSFEIMVFGPFSIIASERRLMKNGQNLAIGGRALDVLIELAGRAGEIVSQRELIARVWSGRTVEEANLRVHIAALRKVLDDGANGSRYLSNVPGRGYCFVSPVSRSVVEAQCRSHVSYLPELTGLPASGKVLGREEFVDDVVARLTSERFVSIVGPGGIGKTTVATAVAHMLIDTFHRAVFFVDLSALTDPRFLPASIAFATGCRIQAQDPVASIVAHLCHRKVLILLDNCEHLIEAVAHFAERMIASAAHVHILTTSREALRARGEEVMILNSLTCPPALTVCTVAQIANYSAGQLFLDRARASGYQNKISDQEATVIADICRKLDGIALAIELVATRAGSIGITGVYELLTNRFSLLWHSRRTALPRHKTLGSLLDWSFNLLSEKEKDVFCCLSVFVGSFTISAACDVAEDDGVDKSSIVAATNELVAKSLLSAEPGSGPNYYRMLETTRAYATSKLAERKQTAAIARRHASFVANLLQASATGEIHNDPSRLAMTVGNSRSALEWSFSEDGDLSIGVKLTSLVAPLWISLSLLDECRSFCHRVLSLVDKSTVIPADEMVLQEALALSSMFTTGNSGCVRSAIERGLDIAEQLNDLDHQFRLLTGLNIFLIRAGASNEALTVAKRANAIALHNNDAVGIVVTEWMLGVSNHLSGDQAAAQMHCELGMAHALQLREFNAVIFGYDHRIRALIVLARTLWLRGHPQQAIQTANHALAEAKKSAQPVSVCISLIYSMPVFIWTGQFESAERYVSNLQDYSARHGLAPYEAIGLGLRGELRIRRGEVAEGLALLQEALSTLASEQHYVLLPAFLGALAEGSCKAGRYTEALFTIDRAIQRAESLQSKFDRPDLLRIKAEILMAMPSSQPDEALALLNDSIRLAKIQSALSYELRSTLALARLFQGKPGAAEYFTALKRVVENFTEGFDTLDIAAAKAFLINTRSRAPDSVV